MPLYRQGTPFKACCEADDGVAAIENAKERAPALVILDLSTPTMNGVEAASVLRGMVPSTKIVGFTTFDEEHCRALPGATAFDTILFKHQGLAKLAEAINALLPPGPPNS